MGGKVPEKFYMSKENFFPKGVELQKVSITSSSAYVQKYMVDGGGNKALR